MCIRDRYEGRSVNDIISDAFPISAQLGLLSLMVAVVGGIAAGAISAMRPNGIVDYAVTILSTIGISVPTFIIGAVLVYVVGFELGWFPVALWRGPSYMVPVSYTHLDVYKRQVIGISCIATGSYLFEPCYCGRPLLWC